MNILMANLNHNMTPIDHLMQMQRQNSRARTFEPVQKLKRNLEDPRANNVNIGLSA
jgi:hypothetical protein